MNKCKKTHLAAVLQSLYVLVFHGRGDVHFWLVVGAVFTLHLFLHPLFCFWGPVMPVYITLLSCHSFYHFCLTALTCVCVYRVPVCVSHFYHRMPVFSHPSSFLVSRWFSRCRFTAFIFDSWLAVLTNNHPNNHLAK